MPALTLLLLAALAGPLGHKADDWDAYANQRFSYAFLYPRGRVRLKREADDGDGREWVARSGAAHGDIYGAYIEDAAAFRERASEAERECAGGRAAYKVARAQLLAVSCITAKGEVLYMKAVRRGDRVIQFDARYPVAERAAWDAVVAGMAQRLMVGEGDG